MRSRFELTVRTLIYSCTGIWALSAALRSAGLYGGGGYGSAVGKSAPVFAAGGMHKFPAALTSFIGRVGPVRELAGLLERYRLVT